MLESSKKKFGTFLRCRFDATETVDGLVAKATKDVQCITTKDAQCIIQHGKDLCFETIYITQYKAVLNGRGPEVYQMLTEAMRKMSLCMRPKAFNAKLELLCALSMYIDRSWVATNRLVPLKQFGEQAYERPVARRWRLAMASVRWRVRVAKWRLEFDREAFRPGCPSALRVADRFRECAKRVRSV